MDCGLTALRKGKDVHYSITWSSLRQADRWEIATSVPATGGVYEIYWMDERKKLRLLILGHARYGGLRSEIRRLIDPELNGNPKASSILEDRPIWFRYAPMNSASDMADVVWFFMKTYFPEKTDLHHSGRYLRIYMNESAPDKVRWVD